MTPPPQKKLKPKSDSTTPLMMQTQKGVWPTILTYQKSPPTPAHFFVQKTENDVIFGMRMTRWTPSTYFLAPPAKAATVGRFGSLLNNLCSLGS